MQDVGCGGGVFKAGPETGFEGERRGFSWQSQTLIVGAEKAWLSWHSQKLVVKRRGGVLFSVPDAGCGGG